LATHKSALKRIRQNAKNHERNVHIRSLIKSRVKKLREAIQAKDTERAQSALSETVREINQARSKGVLQANTASRKISRLTHELNALHAS